MTSKKWSIPQIIGCSCLTLVLLTIGGCGAVLYFVGASFSFNDSEPCKLGQQLAETHPEVIAQIGQPLASDLECRGSIGFNIYTQTPPEANIWISLSGPKGSATLYVMGIKSGNTWDYTQTTLIVNDSGHEIELDRTLIEPR